jgi:hypothetical protein
MEKAFSVSLERAGNSRNVRGVDADADDVRHMVTS